MCFCQSCVLCNCSVPIASCTCFKLCPYRGLDVSLKSVNQLYNVMLVKPTPVCVVFVSNKSCLLFLTFHQSQFRPWKCSHWGGNGGFFSSCDFSRVTVNVSCMLRKISHPTLFVRRTVHEEGIIRSWNIRRHRGLFSCQLSYHVVFTEY